MRAVVTSKRPCKMGRLEVRRVPQDAAFGLVGYHVGCPRCGFVTTAVCGDKGLEIAEGADGLTLGPTIKCIYCCVGIAIHEGEFELTEGPDVRNVSYRR